MSTVYAWDRELRRLIGELTERARASTSEAVTAAADLVVDILEGGNPPHLACEQLVTLGVPTGDQDSDRPLYVAATYLGLAQLSLSRRQDPTLLLDLAGNELAACRPHSGSVAPWPPTVGGPGRFHLSGEEIPE